MRTAIVLAGWAWVLAALPQFTDPGTEFMWGLVLAVSGPAIGLAWVAYSAAAPAVFRARRWRWAWWSVPAGGLLVVLLAASGWGLIARVWLCEGELQAHAEAVRRERSADTKCRVGLFVVQSAYADDGEAVFITAHGFFDTSGVAYLSTPPDPSSRHYRHLYGPWYRYWDDF